MDTGQVGRTPRIMTRGLTALGVILLPIFGVLAACSARDPQDKSGFVDNGKSGSGGASSTGATGGTASVGATGGNLSIGGDTNQDATGVATALVFDPPTVTLVIEDTAAVNTAEFQLVATFESKLTGNVAPEALEFDRPDLASQANGSPVVLTATGAVAGLGTVHAVYGGLEATAELNVQLKQRHVEGTVPDATITALDGAATADPNVSALLYPYDKTVFALGLQSPLFMWTAQGATDVYRLHVEQTGYTYDLYSASAAGQLAIPQEAWDRITSSNSGDALTVTLSRFDAATSMAYKSASVSFTIAPESLRGAIYYWTASRLNAEVGDITRIYPGVGATPESLGNGKCMGCHSVSADGSTMVVDIHDPGGTPAVAPYQQGFANTRPWAAYSLPDATLQLQTTMYGGGPALSPDGKYVVFGNGVAGVPGSKNFSLAVTATGAVVPDSGLDDIVFSGAAMNLMMPSFSLDGTKLAAVEGTGNLVENVIPDSKRIVYMDFDPATAKFNPALHEIANISQFPVGNQGLGYPAFTPDDQFVAYHTGKYSTGCHPKEADEVVNPCLDGSRDGGEIWVSPVAGGTPIRLDALNDPPAAKDHFANREPTFCPVERGGYSWMVFTSMRDWGNQNPADAVGPNINGKRRLWVAAIDKTIGAVDPSHPPFYIEGQANTPNMRGFWALAQCIQTPPPGETGPMCKANFECCSGFCVEGQCVERTKLVCAGIGEACEMSSDCCNQALVDCIDKKCKVRPPPK